MMATENYEQRLRELEEKLARVERRYRRLLASLGVVVIACVVVSVVFGAASGAQAQKPGEAQGKSGKVGTLPHLLRIRRSVLARW